MQLINGQTGLRKQIADWRFDGYRIAFVPTMGNLHAGHLSLVNKAKQVADKVVTSIFINPLQFDNSDDLTAYPRTFDQDSQLLSEQGCDAVFVPKIDEIYPHGMAAQTKVSVPVVTDKLCGSYRPGHFDGVATVVLKLFNIVQPDSAIFGEKDFQQLLLIRKMVADLNLPVDIVAGETVRETDGLAMSSRNQYLDRQQRSLAPKLYEQLLLIKQQIIAGEYDFNLLKQHAVTQLQAFGFEPDYVDICRESDLERAQEGDKCLRIFVAARLGQARLIDNIACYLA